MNFIMDTIKGVFMGIANIIPGVSGGTIALSLGIYDKLIGAISNFLKDWKKSLFTLLPIILGCGIGLVGFTYIIEYLLAKHTFVTCTTFVGLILGGLPVLIRALNKKRAEQNGAIGISGILAFVILFAVSVALPLLGSGNETLKTLEATPGTCITMFFVGVIASATMVIPGVSGSLVLMILGYYYGTLESIKTFLNALKVMDMPVLIDRFSLLFPMGIGILLGIFLIAKLITFLFERYGVQTYCAILGLILASPFPIFYNTGALTTALNVPIIIAGLLFAVVAGVFTYWLGEK